MQLRRATHSDLEWIIALLADDELGKSREQATLPLHPAYAEAFDAIERQAGNEVLVAVDAGAVIGCLQLTLIPGLSRLGAMRAQIEAVRVHREHRGRGVGEALMREAIERARTAGCGLVQLTTDKARPRAHHFYERLGFVASHEGMKLRLDTSA